MLRQKRQADPAKQQQYLALVASETERLTRLINNVLDFSSIDKGKKQYAMRRMDLAEAAREIVESQRVRLESRGFTVSFKPSAGGAAEVRGDPEALKQVVLNLLSNAEKYSAAVKSVAVEVSREADGVAVHVRDRGIGVAEKDRQKIFREFYRVDDSLTTRVQGTGLGLTIARRIARAHAGDVVHEPREGGGSDFVLRLPAPSAPQAGEKG
jgi:signal transduction histidine kinase